MVSPLPSRTTFLLQHNKVSTWALALLKAAESGAESPRGNIWGFSDYCCNFKLILVIYIFTNIHQEKCSNQNHFYWRSHNGDALFVARYHLDGLCRSVIHWGWGGDGGLTIMWVSLLFKWASQPPNCFVFSSVKFVQSTGLIEHA